jgi:ABC-type transporter Mla subunit MlaD
MSEHNTIKDEQVEHAGGEIENLLDGMGDRLNEAVDDISDLADGVEELGNEIKSLLDDLRAAQSKTGEEKKDKLESLIDQLEGVSKELQSTLWTMDFASEDLLENADL